MKEKKPARNKYGEVILYTSLAFLLMVIARGENAEARAEDCPGIRGVITAYQPFAPDGIETGQCSYPCDVTAYSVKVDLGTTVACHKKYPFGTKIYIYKSGGAANGRSYECTDWSGALGPNHIDVAVGNSDNPFAYTDHNACLVSTRPGSNDEVKLTATPKANVAGTDSIFHAGGFVVTAVVTRMPDKTSTPVPTRVVNRNSNSQPTKTPIPNNGVLYEPTPDFIYNPTATLPPDVDFVVGVSSSH